MNFMFFTPAIKSSAIGRMSALVVRELVAQGHSVIVVRSESASLQNQETHDFGVPLIPWNELDRKQIAVFSADQYLFQIGNFYPFHEGCLHWMPILPGIVCLHDYYVAQLFHSWAQSHQQEAIKILGRWYGASVVRNFFNHDKCESFLEYTINNSPLTEWICSMALGVITHSSWDIDRVLRTCPGPVRVVPLAYSGPETTLSRQSKHVANCSNGEIRLLTVGHVNPNKRIESVIMAIGSSRELKRAIVYTIVGKIESAKAQALSALARRLHVRLVIAGEVDNQALEAFFLESDVVSCLRWPVLEAASASAIEAMLYGKAVLCTNAGFYAEIPDDMVFKISVETEVDDIVKCLTDLHRQPEIIGSIGNRASAWASRTFSASHYAEALTEMSVQTANARPIIDACDWFSRVMAKWSAGDVNLLSETDLKALGIFEYDSSQSRS
jgi:glycosyltransferase involved in cell wall biosynthesis